jgi:hypothetical protein
MFDLIDVAKSGAAQAMRILGKDRVNHRVNSLW